MKRWIALLVLAALLAACLPVGALAGETEGSFLFSAETHNQLVAAPMAVTYEAGQTVGEALAQCVELTMDAGSGFVTAIAGVVGNYAYATWPESLTLNSPASELEYLRFSEISGQTLTDAVRSLMQVMADYTHQEADVRSAAREAYDSAYSQYPGISDEAALRCAQAITDAIRAYQAGLGSPVNVTFSGFSGASYEITAQNPHGKLYRDDDHDGVLALPAGEYTFTVRRENCQVSGSVSVSGAMTVTAALPEGQWIKEESLLLSSGYDTEFDEGCYAYTLADHTATVPVPDSFTGRLYPYVELNVTASLAAVYTDTSGQIRQTALPAKSRATSISNVLTRGAQGSTVQLRASQTGSDGYVQSQELTLKLDRMPTLSALRVTNSAGTAQAAVDRFESTKTEYTYKIVNTEKTLTITPTPTVEGYAVTVNGKDATAQGVTVDISGTTVVEVKVSAGEYATTYTLTIEPGAGQKVTFKTGSGITLTVVNKNGEELAYTRELSGNYLYTLVPGEEYAYVATAGEYFHAKKTFQFTNSSLVIDVSVKQEECLNELALGDGNAAKKKGNIALSGSGHRYTATIPDTSSSVSAWITASEDGYDCEAIYQSLSSTKPSAEKTVSLISGSSTGKNLSQALLTGSGYGNTVTFRISHVDPTDGVTYYADYLVELVHTLSIKDLTVAHQQGAVILNRADGETGFDRAQTEYSILVPAAITALDVTPALHTNSPRYGDTDSGYAVTVNGKPASGTVSVPLSGTEQTETVAVTVTNRFAPEAKTVYTLTVRKAATAAVHFAMQPADALPYLFETASGNRIWPKDDGSFALSSGFTYQAAFTKPGYVALSAEMELNEDGSVRLGESSFPASAVKVELQLAPRNSSIQTDIPAQWPDFRGGSSNNAAIDAATPISAEGGMLYWAKKLGEGYDSGAVSSPILVNDSLVVYCGRRIIRVDKSTGEVLASGEMAAASSFAINSASYAEGVILVGLSDGRVQAFHAETLESLWLYQDPLGGQPNCPIVIHNGYAYTGFWNNEATEAAFVCLTLTDENPSETQEGKTASWRHIQLGGFYWAGAYVCDDFILIGTDDGKNGSTSQSSSILMLDPLTGAVLDRRDGLNGDIRCSVCYDSATDAYYFTSKGGSFYRLKAENRKITGLDTLKLQNGTTGTPMSTSTPVVYNGRAYVGVSGINQFSQYGGHNITVIDLNSWEIAYSVPTQGYPQTSGLLTTAYEQSNGYVYVYFFDNYTPGTLRVLRDRQGQTAADNLTAENGYSAAYALFTPSGDQAQYAICSPIADSDGTIYFKNDSGYLMAFGSSVERLEVTSQPTKTHYAAGETFDKSGLVVMATLANGRTRDVTAMMSAPQEALTEGMTTLTLELGRDQIMYRNQENGGAMEAGQSVESKTVTISIQVGEGQSPVCGDLDGSGTVDADDLTMLASYLIGKNQDIDTTLADLNGDGAVTSADAILLAKYVLGTITRFPVEG